MAFDNVSLFPFTAELDEKDHLVLGGCSAVDLASEFGTPLYVYDEETLRGMCREFTNAFTRSYADSKVVYASKAYVNPALARLMAEEGLGLDVVSGGELAVARSVDFPPEDIYFHGNNKTPEELAQAIEYGVGRIVVDNHHELDILDSLARQMDMVQKIWLRLSPSVDPHTHAHTTTGTLDTKFGLSIDTGDAAAAITRALAAPNLNLTGPALPPGLAHLRAGALLHRRRHSVDLRLPVQGPGLGAPRVQPGRRFRHRVRDSAAAPSHRGLRRRHLLRRRDPLRRPRASAGPSWSWSPAGPSSAGPASPSTASGP